MVATETTNDASLNPTASSRVLLLTFTAAIFVSALLLFSVQPLFTKMVLPRLGGAAAVWSVAMVFFQTTLLAGYAYAHAITRFAPGRASAAIHLGVLVLACFALPLHIASGWGRPPQDGEALWLLGLFAASIGLPFFALAANAPLLQAWFARTSHPHAADPYFLYAASNAGSFLALLSYPFVIEPYIRLGQQTLFWSVGFYALIVLIAAAAFLMLRSPRAMPAGEARPVDAAPPRWSDVGRWVFLAAVPSGLLIAVTAHIATDVASVPLLWVVPLALYLLTFVIVFQTRPLIRHELVVKAQPFFVLALVITVMTAPTDSTPILIAVHLAVFFVCVLMCHGELARRRPHPAFLTGYYMWISAGGMIGGILTGLIAPHVFTRVLEYPLLIVLAMLCRPGLAWPSRRSGESYAIVLLVAAATLFLFFRLRGGSLDQSLTYIVVGLLIGVTAQFWRSPAVVAGLVGLLLFGSYFSSQSQSIYTVRNFFGVLNVGAFNGGRFHGLWHGTTGQGAQKVRDDEGNLITGRPEMIAEFQKGGGITQVFEALRARSPGPIDFAVVGLGTGTLACQVQPGDRLTYYELDPDIARIARNPRFFTYISECAPKTQVVLGDARLTLGDAPDGSYDLIFVDAFLGAAIPIHLLTREAMALYFQKLKPNGILAMHISNRNLELATVVVGAAESHGLVSRIYDGGDVEEDAEEVRWVPRVAVIARQDADLGRLAKAELWPLRKKDPQQQVWTDDYSNIVGAMIRNLRERGELR